MQARALPWLLVLPALLFASPLSPLADDPYPHLAGFGLAVLCLAPLACLVALRGRAGPRAWPFLAVLVWALLSGWLVPSTDAFEARRALCGLALLPLLFTAGSSLDGRGRGTLADLLVALSCAWTGWALARGFAGDGFAGVQGDTGSLSQAALPGAAVAAAWIARGTGRRRFAGAVALALFCVHVAAAPVLAGSHTLLAALLLGAWRGEPRGRGMLLGLALTSLMAPFLGMAIRQAADRGTPLIEGAPNERSHSLGGLAVRGRVWTATLPMIAEAPVTGVGPGQFQARFPPYRDPAEIELSRHGVCSELDTEVEHAHNDWLQGFCELGLVGGALLALGLGLAAREALRGLAMAESAPLAMGALALLVNAFVHAPISGNAAACVLGLGLFGALSPPTGSSRSWALVFALPSLLALPFALPLVRHGAALSTYIHGARYISERVDSPEERESIARAVLPAAERARKAIQDALEAAPASAPARELAARNAEEGQRRAAWERVLEVRPHAVGAWERSAIECERAGLFPEAGARYRKALELSPTHPRLLRRLARLECADGELDSGLLLLDRLRDLGCQTSDGTAALGVELILELGLPERGARVWMGATLTALRPEELHARHRAKEATEGGDAEECLAQLLWAREHADAGNFAAALRNYRQAANQSHARRGSGAGPAALYTLEMAAAEAREGLREPALARAQAASIRAPTWKELPPWARTTLLDLGIPAPR